AALVMDRDDDPLAEPIPQLAAALRPHRQSRFEHLTVADAVFAQEPNQVVLAQAGRREPDLKFGERAPGDSPSLQLDQGSLPGRVLHKDVVEIADGDLVQPFDRPLELPPATGPLRFLELDAGL